MKKITQKRAAERAQYRKQIAVYLAAHPFCQLWIAVHRLDEVQLIADGGWYSQGLNMLLRQVPRASQIHHRNKGRGARLLDERWWMAVSFEGHNQIENQKSWARLEGYLLPIQADADGKWGSGNQALETPELLASKA